MKKKGVLTISVYVIHKIQILLLSKQEVDLEQLKITKIELFLFNDFDIQNSI